MARYAFSAVVVVGIIAGGCAHSSKNTNAHSSPSKPVHGRAAEDASAAQHRGASTGAAAASPGSASVHWNFDALAYGQLPPRWSLAETKPSRALARWEVIADPAAASGNQVFALIETLNDDPTFNLAIADDTSFRDIDLSVKVKAVRGAVDQGGGAIWRCKDANNYYIARINPLESNYRVYKVIAGQRKQLATARVELEAGRWYTLGVAMRGGKIECSLDGKVLLVAEDDALPGAGRIGLWTKADAVTSFDDLVVHATH